ncbi:MAG: hypothetical protein QF464_01885, partial [Myxococcota bacterium]|nr:hypothetical protein [Myxococcota bacterium]
VQQLHGDLPIGLSPYRAYQGQVKLGDGPCAIVPEAFLQLEAGVRDQALDAIAEAVSLGAANGDITEEFDADLAS